MRREKTVTVFIRNFLLMISTEKELRNYNSLGRSRKGSKPKLGFMKTFPRLTTELIGYYINLKPDIVNIICF